jgi:hypothetical protein
MVSVKAIENEVFGSCVGETNVSAEIESRAVWLCCGWKYRRFILAGKAAQDWMRRWAMVPDIGLRFGVLLGLIEKMKSPCAGRGFWW